MKYLKSYNEMNEGLIDFLKKSLTGLIDSLGETTRKIVGDTSKNIERSKNLNESKLLIEKTFETRKKMIEEQTNYITLLKLVKDDFTTIEILLTALNQKFKKDELKPKTFFADSSNKVVQRIFNFDKSDRFQGALQENVKMLMIELGKKAGVENIEEKFATNESKIYEAQEISPN